jgi:hypothetical protein
MQTIFIVQRNKIFDTRVSEIDVLASLVTIDKKRRHNHFYTINLQFSFSSWSRVVISVITHKNHCFSENIVTTINLYHKYEYYYC